MKLPIITISVRIRRAKLVRDTHPYPHNLNDANGCACECPQCVQLINGMIRCICPRCNRDCPSIGRLGPPDSVAEGKRQGWPGDKHAPGSGWYLR